MKPDLVAIGETMAQIVPDEGTVQDAKGFSVHVAGAESNVAIGFARLGGAAAWLSRVGDDALGRRVVAAVTAERVDVSGVIVDTGRPTGLFVKDVSGDARPVVYYRDGSAASALSAQDTRRACAMTPKAVHATGVTAALSTTAAEAIGGLGATARSAGSLFSFDVNHRPALWPDLPTAAESLRRSAMTADVVFVGRDEAEGLWGVSTAAQIRDVLPDVPLLVVKDSDVEATAFFDGQRISIPAPTIDVVEPVGAGDAFAAGFLRAFLRGDSVASALALGHQVAGVALRSRDDHGDMTAVQHCWQVHTRRSGQGHAAN